jgi:hypothetical protein
VQFTTRLWKQEALKEVLPDTLRLPSLITKDHIVTMLVSPLVDTTVQALHNTVKHTFDQSVQSLTGLNFENLERLAEPFSLSLSTILTPQLLKVFLDLLQFIPQEKLEELQQPLLAACVRGVSNYIALLQGNPEISALHQAYRQAWKDCAAATAEDEVALKKTILEKAHHELAEGMRKNLFVVCPTLAQVGDLVDVVSIGSQLKVVPTSPQAVVVYVKQIVQAFKNENKMAKDWNVSLLAVAESMLAWLRTSEEALIGFSYTSEKDADYLVELCNLHALPALAVTLLSLTDIKSELSSEEVKQVYQQILKAAQHQYRYLPSFVVNAIADQITHM